MFSLSGLNAAREDEIPDWETTYMTGGGGRQQRGDVSSLGRRDCDSQETKAKPLQRELAMGGARKGGRGIRRRSNLDAAKPPQSACSVAPSLAPVCCVLHPPSARFSARCSSFSHLALLLFVVSADFVYHHNHPPLQVLANRQISHLEYYLKYNHLSLRKPTMFYV